jgi:hypothetical protein
MSGIKATTGIPDGHTVRFFQDYEARFAKKRRRLRKLKLLADTIASPAIKSGVIVFDLRGCQSSELRQS